MDQERIEKAVYELLSAIGEDPERSGLKETPNRVARMYAEIFSGIEEDPHQYLKIFDCCLPRRSSLFYLNRINRSILI